MIKSWLFRWKWLLLGLFVVLMLGTAFLTWRFTAFVGATTGGGRTSGYLETPPATNSLAQPFQLETIPLAAPTPTVNTQNFANSDLVQRIRAGQSVTILVAGYGGNNHAGQWLTDTILLMRFDPKTKTMTELNIPRDLYVFIPYGGKTQGRWAKINNALPTIMEWNQPTQDALDPRYRWSDPKKQFDSGVNLLSDTVELVTGWRVDYWATLSFEGFRRFIDAMGGLDVKVERSFVDHKYPRNDNDAVDASLMTIQFQAGLQHLDGERAIEYARSRYSDNVEEQGDFARSQRQMNLLNTLKTQVFKQNLVLKSLDYMEALQGQVRFSADFGELVALANYFNSDEGKALANSLKIMPAVLNDRLLLNKNLSDGSYILLPNDGQGDYTSIQRWLNFVTLDNQFALQPQTPKVQILNGNGRVGLAGRLTDFLVDKGFRMTEEMDGENRNDTVVFDYSGGQAAETINRLKTYLPHLKVLPLAADQRPKNAPSDVTLQICLGKDFDLTALTNSTKK